MKTSYYNLHDLLSLRFCCEDNANAGYFERRFSYFRSVEQPHCDINIYYNLSHDHKSAIPESQVVMRDTGRRRLGKWRVSIGMREKNKFDIFFDGNKFSLKYLFFNFLEPLINYVLISQGGCLVHASCFSQDDKAIVVHGYPSSGKTSILLRALKKSWDYLSDEMTIISSSGIAYAYPTPLNFCDYNFNQDVSLTLSWPQIIKKNISKVLRIISSGKVKPTILIEPKSLLNGGKIVAQRQIGLCCVIADADRDTAQMSENILQINQCQYQYFRGVLDRETKNNPDGVLNRYWQDMLEVIESFCIQVSPMTLRRQQDFEMATGMFDTSHS